MPKLGCGGEVCRMVSEQSGSTSATIDHCLAALHQDNSAEAHHQLGSAYAAIYNFDAAEASYRTALKINPDFAPALYDLGVLLHYHGDRSFEAVRFLEWARAVAPDHIEVHRVLGSIFRNFGVLPKALESYKAYVKCLPQSAHAHVKLGALYSEGWMHDEAIAHLREAIRLDTTNSTKARFELADALLRAKKPDFARKQYADAMAHQTVATFKARSAAARFSVLLILGPGYVNTPYGHLVAGRDYDVHILPLLESLYYDIPAIRARVDVVVNLISGAERSENILLTAAVLFKHLGLPVVNHPQRISMTDRATIAQRLAHIPGCRIARCIPVSGAALCSDVPTSEVGMFNMPFLARVSGLHGGDQFEKIASITELREFAAKRPEADYYLMDYLDYQSSDGHYRKYRFFCIGGQILPYHLAIGDQWKVHHFNTDMINTVWMQQEEKAFLMNAGAVFGPAQMATLDAITKTIGLEFMGIDCALDREGNVVVFEANATMLVNGNTSDFPYKAPSVKAIKIAFGAMLSRMVKSASP